MWVHILGDGFGLIYALVDLSEGPVEDFLGDTVPTDPRMWIGGDVVRDISLFVQFIFLLEFYQLHPIGQKCQI